MNSSSAERSGGGESSKRRLSERNATGVRHYRQADAMRGKLSLERFDEHRKVLYAAAKLPDRNVLRAEFLVLVLQSRNPLCQRRVRALELADVGFEASVLGREALPQFNREKRLPRNLLEAAGRLPLARVQRRETVVHAGAQRLQSAQNALVLLHRRAAGP